MRLTGGSCSLELSLVGFEDPEEPLTERDEDSWVTVAGTATNPGSAPVHANLSFELGEARALATWLRDVAAFVSSGAGAPSLFWTTEPEFAAEAVVEVSGMAVVRCYLFDPQSAFQPIPEVGFNAKVVEVRADVEDLHHWADEWDEGLARL